MPSKYQTLEQMKRRAITRIHVGKTKLGMDDDEYRFMLREITGKTSSKAMDLGELKAIEDHLAKLGFKPVRKSKANKRTSPVSRNKEASKKTMVDKLRALWIDMAREGLIRDGSENALESWVQRMSARLNQGRGIQKVDWLHQSPDICWQLIENLKQWRKRLEAK